MTKEETAATAGGFPKTGIVRKAGIFARNVINFERLILSEHRELDEKELIALHRFPFLSDSNCARFIKFFVRSS